RARPPRPRAPPRRPRPCAARRGGGRARPPAERRSIFALAVAAGDGNVGPRRSRRRTDAATHGGRRMVPLDHVLAVAVLIAPADCGPAPEHAGVWRTIQEAALSLELLDPREARYVLSRAEDFEVDLPLVRRRLADLGGAPPLAHAWLFPPPG